MQNQQAQYQAMLNQQQNINNVPTQVVSDFSTVQVSSVPMDANGALFIKNDRSEIQAKYWTQDGKINTTVYLPQIQNEGNNSSQEEIKGQNDAFNEFAEAFNEKISTLFDRLDTIEDLLSVKPTKRTTKKEVVENE